MKRLLVVGLAVVLLAGCSQPGEGTAVDDLDYQSM